MLKNLQFCIAQIGKISAKVISHGKSSHLLKAHINSKHIYYINTCKIERLLNAVFLCKYKLHVSYRFWSLRRIRWYTKMSLWYICNYSTIKCTFSTLYASFLKRALFSHAGLFVKICYQISSNLQWQKDEKVPSPEFQTS